jgi:HD-GYP domain-containing protein (c-di-GMP phosphodiesterase class II)
VGASTHPGTHLRNGRDGEATLGHAATPLPLASAIYRDEAHHPATITLPYENISVDHLHCLGSEFGKAIERIPCARRRHRSNRNLQNADLVKYLASVGTQIGLQWSGEGLDTMQGKRSSEVRLAELTAALSIATDLGMGQPINYALCSSILAVRLGEKLKLSETDLRDVYYYALLRYIGCNAETPALAAIVGDEITMRRDIAKVDNVRLNEIISVITHSIRQTHVDASPLSTVLQIAHGLLSLPEIKSMFHAHCEVAQMLGERMGFGEGVICALGQLYERWDGRGAPNGLKGDQVALPVLIVTLAQDAITFHRLGGVEAAVAIARERKGSAYAPMLVDCFCNHAAELLTDLDEEPSWELSITLEPGAQEYLTESEFDTVCLAIADFIDVKSPSTLGHSRGVADIAAEAARLNGLPDTDRIALRRAALLHDVGRVSVSARLWEKAGEFTEREWEQVRMHPYYTERILARPKSLARLGALGSLHHERLDGSGYYRGATATMLSPSARILAAADAYQRMTEPRPHRPAATPEAAADHLRRELRAGRLDTEAVNGVLTAAGHHVSPKRRELVAGLSEREVEVLRLVARGQSMKQVAAALTISEKTVDNHIQHIYEKIGVSTRAGAALFAVEQNLLQE